MAYFFKVIGLFTLIFGTFFYTDKVMMISKNSDDLLFKIESVKNKYEKPAIEAIIDKNTIIPGKNGKTVDVMETYNRLSQSLNFNDNLFVYKVNYVKNRLFDNKDKFIIGGCSGEKNVALAFKVYDNTSISKIENILNNKSVLASFFVTSFFLENNYELVSRLIDNGHTVGILNTEDFVWMKTILTNVGKQKNNYCYASFKDFSVLRLCSLYNSYTVVPGTVIDTSPFIEVKKNLKNGLIISFGVNDNVNLEMENIINYILGKGYKILPLEEFLKE